MVKKKEENEIKFDRRNYRIHDDRNKELIKKSLSKYGAGRSILIDAENEIIAGNGVYEQAQALGMNIKIVESDGKDLIAIKRTDLFAKRMQIQERMTAQIADVLMQGLDARGVYVVCEGVHFCMRSRGVKKQDASMITSAIRGIFKTDAKARQEFLTLIKG